MSLSMERFACVSKRSIVAYFATVAIFVSALIILGLGGLASHRVPLLNFFANGVSTSVCIVVIFSTNFRRKRGIISIDDERIHCEGKHRKAIDQLLSEVTDLSIKSYFGRLTRTWQISFRNLERIEFDTDVQNRRRLVALLEERTGKKFEASS
ncbi:MAG: hypothetical protein GC165_04015 [Armatimonadetes bacterium]|nr:hypothetical protein [Armatimonadota bacterium]